MRNLMRMLAMLMLISTLVFAQNAPIDFETGGFGASWTWNVFENSTNPALEIVSNPDASGINTSATVAKFTALAAGQPWAGTESAHGAIGTFNLDATNCTIKIMVYKTKISDVGIKLVKPDGWSMGEIKVANTVINQWEELTFDFSSQVSDGYDQIVVFPDFTTRTADDIVYFDNITFSAQAAPEPDPAPTTAAPTPTEPADSVISLYSDAYTDVTVDTWSAGWDVADVADTTVAGNATKLYTNISYAGIEFTSAPIDASAMTYFHMDIWTPDATDGGQVFKVKLVDAGADGDILTGADNVEHEVILSSSSTPAIASEQWVSLDIPMSDFSGLITKGHLAQMIISGSLPTVWVDNVYFYTSAVVPEPDPAPTVAAPTPTEPADSVISLYSDAYTDVTVDTWSAGWDNANVVDTSVAGNATKLYTGLGFAGIVFEASTVDASDMTHIHLDIWTPDATDGSETFKVKLRDYGANGVWDASGDDVEHEVVLTNSSTPSIASEQWVSLDIPLSDFTGLVTKGHLAQLVISGDLPTVWLDNVYFYSEETTAPGPDAPLTAAPTPTMGADSVISLYSDAYTDVTVDTWSAGWDVADVADTNVAGNATKLYTNISYAGIEFTSAPIDASAMTYFHMDIWTPDATNGGQVFKVKLVDAGADGDILTGADNVEHEVILSSSSTPAIASEQWVSLDIPMSDFSGLITKGHLAQMIISGGLPTVWVDNVYFYNDGSAPVVIPSPMVAAPTPTVGADSVISLYSDAYTDVTVDTWSAGWDVANLVDTSVVGNATKLYTSISYAGIEFTSAPIDASDMTYFHMDIWTPDATDGGQVFKIKLVDAGADGDILTGADNVEHEVILSNSSLPAIASEQWVSLDIPLNDFTNLVTKGHLAQLIISGDLPTVWVDNVYFYMGALPAVPEVAAPVPDERQVDVISLFSDVYDDVPVDTWSAAWDGADVSDYVVTGDSVKLYENMIAAGIEFTATTIDASTMEYFHMDLWTPNSTNLPNTFKLKLVDFGANGTYGGGDDVEHEMIFSDTTSPRIYTAGWVSLDIPLSEFTGLTTKAHLAQMIFAGDLSTVYVDNIYFYKEATPTVSAPTPTAPASNVVSLFSNAYTNIPVTTWSTDWDWAGVEDYLIGSDDVKKYTTTGYTAAEFMANATDMTHFHVDMWTPDVVTGKQFKIKLVDFGPDGAYGGGDDVLHELTFTDASTPALERAGWISFDIPMDDFTGLTTQGHIAQLIFSWGAPDDLGTFYVDNIYFYNDVTAIDETVLPTEFALEQNYPNPFNPTTTIRFNLPEANHVTMTLYNMLGREIATLVNEYKEAGSYDYRLDASNLPTGTYFYSIVSGDFKEVRKMVLII